MKDLRVYLEDATGHTLVELSFDGRSLAFRIRDDQITISAKGEPWDQTYVIHASRLHPLPNQFISANPQVAILNQDLTIGDSCYRGVFGKPDWVYWMPDPDGVTFVMHSSQREVAGAIRCLRGQEMDKSMYWYLLADRLNDYALNSHDPQISVTDAAQVLDEVAALVYHDVSIEDCGQAFVFNNLDIQERLYLSGIPGRLPKIIDENVEGAEDVYYSSDLEWWANAVS